MSLIEGVLRRVLFHADSPDIVEFAILELYKTILQQQELIESLKKYAGRKK